MEIPVCFEKITYQKDNFCIVSANLDPNSELYSEEMENLIKPLINQKYNNFTVVISNLMTEIDNIQGTQYVICGDIKNDPKRGYQFVADFIYLDTPTNEDGLRAFLMNLSNIKEIRSRAIIKKFGVEGTIDVFENHPEKLLQINGITKERLEVTKKEWKEKRYMCKLFYWLSKNGVSLKLADKIYKLWGDKCIDVLEKNPYRLVELRGVGFLIADKIAHNILKEIPHEFRMTACVQYVLEEQVFSDSNLCTPYAYLKNMVVKTLTECDQSLNNKKPKLKYEDLFKNCILSNLEVFSVVQDIEESITYVYLKSIWNKENYIVNSMFEISSKVNKINVEKIINNVIGV